MIDVKTTYMDWEGDISEEGFISGGFAGCAWKNLQRIEMKHEFYIAGTDNPANVKGFVTYNSISNSQVLSIDKNDIDDVWINKNAQG